MRIIALSFLITFFSSLVSTAVINFEAFGISKSKVYNLSENRMYINYSNEGTKLEIDYFGKRYPVIVTKEPLLDPENKRLKS